MSNIRKFKGKSETREVEFMSGKVTIKKLTTGEILELGDRVKTAQENVTEDDQKLALVELLLVLNKGLVFDKDESPLTLEEIYEYPMDALGKLSKDIMDFSGAIQSDEGNA